MINLFWFIYAICVFVILLRNEGRLILTILDELKKYVSEYQCDFKTYDMAGVIISHKTFQDIRARHPLGFIETSDGDAYLYGLLMIKHPLCPDDKAYVINQDVVNDIIWSQMLMRGDTEC